jgi:hypothetical protein
VITGTEELDLNGVSCFRFLSIADRSDDEIYTFNARKADIFKMLEKFLILSLSVAT